MQGWHLTAVNSGNVALYFSASITGVLNGKKMQCEKLITLPEYNERYHLMN